ncbi:serine/threonine protein kinase [bacterium]|nr:serine/threonine protein kinase [candidate division CSSED10-310 bacterium]
MFDVGQIILDVYVVEKYLGAGGAGEVFLVRRSLDNMRYAVKTVHSKKMNSTRLRQDLLREIRVTQSLGDHPHIVPSRFFRLIDGNLAVFSDYISGGTLHSWIRAGKIRSRDRLLDVAIQIAWGLDAAHSGGIIHKDIKPANILMERDGRARVADFGLIRGMTPAFCSPEQAAEEELTPATDLWSWALVVMNMWFGTGKWILGPQAPVALEYLSRSEWPCGPAPNALMELLSRCLDRHPENRPATALEIAETLRTLYVDLGSGPYPRPDPPELTASSTGRSGPARCRSIVDGRSFADPRQLLDEIFHKVNASTIDLESLVPELHHIPDTFVDDLHAYLFIEDILHRISAEGDPDWLYLLALTLKRKALILFDSGDAKSAALTHGQCRDVLKELILWHDRADLWMDLATQYIDITFCHLHLAQFDTARDSIEQARRAADKTPESHRNEQYYLDYLMMLGNQGIIAAKTGDPDHALMIFKESLGLLDSVADRIDPVKLKKARAQAEFNCATHLQKIFRFEESVNHFLSALQFQTAIAADEEPNERVFLSSICMNLAVTLAELDRLDKAAFFFDRTRSILDDILAKSDHHYVIRKKALYYRNLGLFNHQRGRCEDAATAAREGIDLMTSVLEKRGSVEYASLLASLYQDFARYLEEMNRLDEAREAREQAERFDNGS